MRTCQNVLLIGLPLLCAACSGSFHSLPPGGGRSLPSNSTVGGESNTFSHDNDSVDPFDLLARLEREGPDEVSARLHSCQKITYAALAHLLASRGVDLSAPGANGIPSAGELFQGGAQALGAPNYDARVAEAVEPTAAGATKLFDIFVQAAPQIIANLPNVAACQVRGAGVPVFGSDGRCNPEGLTCLMGYPATDQHVALCNLVLTQASSPGVGRIVAVAALMSAVHTCE
ncbi:MAG TPA: hypothetical protein VKN99_14420 [Polyangia bacterium]|nr:hypothetical protein [Polyangia bacterium]